MNLVEAKDLSMHYGDVVALDRVSLMVPENSIFAILGPNGAGKTTLLDLLVNLQTPTAGTATVLGTDSRRLRRNLFEHIGYVSDNQQLAEWMTVRYFLDYLRPFYPTWDKSLERELMSEFQVPQNRKLGNLSRGMRMKMLLASSMAYRPKLLILDEPFSGLDPLTREELIAALLDSANETTVLLSSHDLPEIETFVTHVGFLDDGRLRFSEELATLTSRFREISVTLDDACGPASWSSNWICLESAGACARFVDTAFHPDWTEAEVRARFDGIRRIETAPMPLRSIFLALARIRKAEQSRSIR